MDADSVFIVLKRISDSPDAQAERVAILAATTLEEVNELGGLPVYEAEPGHFVVEAPAWLYNKMTEKQGNYFSIGGEDA